MKNLPRLIPVALLAFTLAGCASTGKVAEVKDANEKKIEYVYYTPTGSNIPVRIRKDQLPTGDNQSDSDQAALRKLLQQSSRPDKSTGQQ